MDGQCMGGQCMGGQWAVKGKEPIKTRVFSTRQLYKNFFRPISLGSYGLFSFTHYSHNEQLLNEAEHHLKNF